MREINKALNNFLGFDITLMFRNHKVHPKTTNTMTQTIEHQNFSIQVFKSLKQPIVLLNKNTEHSAKKII